MSNASAICAIEKPVLVLGQRPAEQGQVVGTPSGRNPLSRYIRKLDSGSRLLSFLLPSPMTYGQVAEPAVRPVGDADRLQRLVQRELARRRRQQVLAAQHVGDAHQRVVDRVDQRVERLTVAAHEHVVGDVLGGERDLATRPGRPT